MSTFLVHEEEYRGKGYVEYLKKNILIAGCGALGSNLAYNLVKHGFTNLSLLDFDRVESKNIGPQIYSPQYVGMTKVDALINILYDINQNIQLKNLYTKLDSKNCAKTLKGADLVVDCFDNREARLILTDYCRENNIDCIHAGLFKDYGEVIWNENYKVPDQAPKSDDQCDYPLARNIVLMTVVVLTEEILNFYLRGRIKAEKKNRFLTLKDLTIGEFRV